MSAPAARGHWGEAAFDPVQGAALTCHLNSGQYARDSLAQSSDRQRRWIVEQCRQASCAAGDASSLVQRELSSGSLRGLWPEQLLAQVLRQLGHIAQRLQADVQE